jgi:hypothetical protein
MAIRLHAEYTGHGILLSRIETQDNVESVRNFLGARSIAATVGPLSLPGDYRVFLPEMTMEQFLPLAEDWSLECDIATLRQQIGEKVLADEIRKQSAPD